MSDEIVNEARQGGWVPKEEFRGDETTWVDAETFVERGRQINPILRANNERLKKELAETNKKYQAELEDVKRTAAEFKVFQKEAADRKVQQLERQLKELRAARSEATVQEDHEKAAEIEERIDAVKEQVAEAKTTKPVEQPKTEQAPEFTPEMKQWFGNNTWYGDQENYLEETELVNSLGTAIRKRHPTVTGIEFLEMLDQKISEYLPNVKSKRKGASVEGGNRSSRSTPGKQSYENLPADAKAACDKYVKQGLMTREDYVKEYDWS